MAVTYSYAQSARLMAIEQQLLPTLREDNPAFEILPFVTEDVAMLMWDQLDNFTGMMQPRGAGGKPLGVKAKNINRYKMQPGYYGEFMTIEEWEATNARQMGTFGDVLDVFSLSLQRGNQLMHRQIKREIWLIWQLVCNGYFLTTDPFGVIMHEDSYTQRTLTAATAFSNTTTATPLAVLRGLKQMARGYSVSFGRDSKMYANADTVNNILNNSNAADLGGKRSFEGGSYNNLSEVNEILVSNDLPVLVQHDGIWQDDSLNNNLDIGANEIIVKGKRTDGAPLGNLVSTRNTQNSGLAPGPYYKSFVNPYEVPEMVQIHRGINVGPKLTFPSGIIKIAC